MHLSGWAEEWILWATTEFDFLDLPDAFCTGSSIMPHKKNPDVLELIRGKTARVVGDLQQLLVLVKGLPLAYNRDLQEDKAALFDAFDTVAASLELAAAAGRARRGCGARVIAARLEDGFLDATTLMEFLIAAGRADAVGARGGRQAGPAVRGAPLPAGRPAGGGVRKRPPGPGAGGIQGVGRRQRAGRVPQCRLDRAGRGRAADRGVAAAIERSDVDRHELPIAGVGLREPPLDLTRSIMDHFHYRDRVLHCEDVPVAELAETYGTPLFVYSQATLLHHLQQLQTAFAEVEAAHLLQRQDQRQPRTSAG